VASVFKRKRDRGRKGASWYIAHTDENGKRRTVKGCTDKAATEGMARKLETEAQLRRRGVIDPKTDGYASNEARPLCEHLNDWKAYLLGKGSSLRHANEGHARVVKLMADAEATRLSDLTLSRVQAALAIMKDEGLSLRTVHHYTRLAKNFTRWAWHDGRSREDLLAHLRTPDNVDSDRRRERRVLPMDELLRLIAAAERGPVIRKLAGPDRAMMYRIAAGTGYRSGEIQSLTPESFDVDAPCPSITVDAKNSKRRQHDVQPIQPALASILKPWLATKPKDQAIFPVSRWAILIALQGDLLSAGIEYENDDGVADFHALRHGYITALAKSNASVKVVQSLARHSTPTLTLGVYSHIGLIDQSAALDALPDLAALPAPVQYRSKTANCDTALSQLDSILTAPGQRASDGIMRKLADSDASTRLTVPTLMDSKPFKNRRLDATWSKSPPTGDNGSACAAGAGPGLQNR
jgi:integrase